MIYSLMPASTAGQQGIRMAGMSFSRIGMTAAMGYMLMMTI
jgi:hypothetical protein